MWIGLRSQINSFSVNETIFFKATFSYWWETFFSRFVFLEIRLSVMNHFHTSIRLCFFDNISSSSNDDYWNRRDERKLDQKHISKTHRNTFFRWRIVQYFLLKFEADTQPINWLTFLNLIISYQFIKFNFYLLI